MQLIIPPFLVFNDCFLFLYWATRNDRALNVEMRQRERREKKSSENAKCEIKTTLKARRNNEMKKKTWTTRGDQRSVYMFCILTYGFCYHSLLLFFFLLISYIYRAVMSIMRPIFKYNLIVPKNVSDANNEREKKNENILEWMS